MRFDFKKIDYSKFNKKKAVAVIGKNNIGLRFSLILKEIIGVDVEYYSVEKDENNLMENSLLRELNNDADIVLIIQTYDSHLGSFICEEKRFDYISPENEFYDEFKVNIININKVISRLESLME